MATAETIGVLPFAVHKGVVLPAPASALEESLTRGLQTSGYLIVPSTNFDPSSRKAGASELPADFLVQSTFENAGVDGIAVTLDLIEKGGRRINRERTTCVEPDCSLGGALRLMGKELVRLGLHPKTPADTPVVATSPSTSTNPPVSPVDERKTESNRISPVPTWAKAALIGGGALLIGGGVLWALDGRGTECDLANSACAREFDTKTTATAAMAVGAVSLAAGVVGAFWRRQDEQTSLSLAISPMVAPSLSGLSLLGRY